MPAQGPSLVRNKNKQKSSKNDGMCKAMGTILREISDNVFFTVNMILIQIFTVFIYFKYIYMTTFVYRHRY